MKDLISIIIPVYNSEAYISAAIDSCLRQTYQHLELVIINDGSTDKSEMLIFEILKDRPQLLKYISQKNQGLCGARNTGIQNSTGKYILFLDSDDLLHPDAIETLASQMANNDVVLASWQDFNLDNLIVNKVIYNTNINKNPLLSYLIYKPTVSTALIKREALIMWDQSMKTWDVTNYFLELFINNKKFFFINKIVTSIRQHNNPKRLSLLNNHFEPIYSSLFFSDCKKKLLAADILDVESEMILDKDIIHYLYAAYNKKNSLFCKRIFLTVNMNLVKKYQNFKSFGLYSFIIFFNGFYGLSVFKTINKYLGRV